jgi:hypothetical protein
MVFNTKAFRLKLAGHCSQLASSRLLHWVYWIYAQGALLTTLFSITLLKKEHKCSSNIIDI